MSHNPFALNRVAHEMESARLALVAGDPDRAHKHLVSAQERLTEYLAWTR